MFPLKKFVIFLALTVSGAAQQATEWEPLSGVPDRLEAVRDEKGFYWQPTGAGSFYSMGANVFKSANQITIDGDRFDADRAFKQSEQRYAFEEDRDDLHIRRDLWLDLERSAARHLDIFENRTDRERTITVVVETDFSYSWQDLYSQRGKIIGTELGPRDAGLLIKFDPSDGQSDLLYLLSSESSPVQPKLKTGNNNREISFIYELKLPPNGKAALACWTGQRTLTDLGEIPGEFTPLYARRQLLRPNLPRNIEPGMVRNFNVEKRLAPGEEPHNPAALVGLNRLLERLNTQRGGEDLLWISEVNQLSGEVDPGSPVEMETGYGTVTAELGDLTALRGGGGRGRLHEVYFRNGEVYVGTATAGSSRMTGADGWEMDLELEELETLLFRVEAEDGKLAGDVWGFAQMDTGDILAVSGPPAPVLKFTLPWGVYPVSLKEIRRLDSVSVPSPRHHLELKNGTYLTGFVMPGYELNLENGRLGEVTVEAARLRGFWATGEYEEADDSGGLDFFEDWERTAGEAGGPWIWLDGGNRLAARLPGQKLHFLTGSTVTELSPEEISSIRRTDEGLLDQLPLFEIELLNGDPVNAQLRDRKIAIEVAGALWNVPATHFLGYRSSIESK